MYYAGITKHYHSKPVQPTKYCITVPQSSQVCFSLKCDGLRQEVANVISAAQCTTDAIDCDWPFLVSV